MPQNIQSLSMIQQLLSNIHLQQSNSPPLLHLAMIAEIKIL